MRQKNKFVKQQANLISKPSSCFFSYSTRLIASIWFFCCTEIIDKVSPLPSLQKKKLRAHEREELCKREIIWEHFLVIENCPNEINSKGKWENQEESTNFPSKCILFFLLISLILPYSLSAPCTYNRISFN